MHCTSAAAVRADDVAIIGTERDTVTGLQCIALEPVETLTQFSDCFDKLIESLIRHCLSLVGRVRCLR